MAESQAILPAFVLGLVVAKVFTRHREEQRRFRVVAFALLTPFFFVRSGMNVSLPAVYANVGLLVAMFGVKVVSKIGSVLPLARKYVPHESNYTTLLLSTGLTFDTIAALYGLNAGIIDKTQFSLLVTAVIASAIVPTIIAQRFFDPLRYAPSASASMGEGLARAIASGTGVEEPYH